MRVILADNWFTFYPDKKDEAGHYLCRYCHKPVIKGYLQQKTYYCSDECKSKYWHLLHSFTWDYTRKLVYNRDDGTCKNCGKKVLFSLNDCERGKEGELAEIHHLISVSELDDVAWIVSREADDHKREYWYLVFRIMLQNDLNNLVTLCRHPCHDLAHNHLNNELRKNGRNTLDKY